MSGVGQPSHWIWLILIVAVLFGGKRLPDAARYFGRSLRVFKSEMKEMKSDDTKDINESKDQSSPEK
jgi:sec-independent protein translocase protein TatA